MALERPGGAGSSMSQINVTPLVDVMLVLLVIFMVTAPILQQGVAVDLPEVAAGPLDGKAPPVIVSLTREGRIYLAGSALSLGELERELARLAQESPRRQLLVRADESVPYGDVVAVMARARSAGIRRVGMVTALPRSTG